MTPKTPWEILNVTPESTLAEIKKSYAKLAKENNPEDNPEEFRKLNDAYKACSSIAKLRAKGQTVVVVQKDGTQTTLSSTSKKPEASSEEASKSDFNFDSIDSSVEEPTVPQVVKHELSEDFDTKDLSSSESDFDFSNINSEEATYEGLDPAEYFNKICYETHMKHPNNPFTDKEIVEIAIKYLSYINADQTFSHNKMIWEQYKHNRLVVDAFTLPIFEEEVNKIGLRYNDAKSLCMCVGGKSKPVFDSKENTYRVNLDFTSQYYIDTYMSRIHRQEKAPVEPKPASDDEAKDSGFDEPQASKVELNEIPEVYFARLIREKNLEDFDPDNKDEDFEFASKTAKIIDTVIEYLRYIIKTDEYKDNIWYYSQFKNNSLVKFARGFDAFLGKINAQNFDEEPLKLLARALGPEYEVGPIPNAPTTKSFIYKKAVTNKEPDYKHMQDSNALHSEYLRQIELAKQKNDGVLPEAVKVQLVMHYIFLMNKHELYNRPSAWNLFTNDNLVKQVFYIQKFKTEMSKIYLREEFAKKLAHFYHRKCKVKVTPDNKAYTIVIPPSVKQAQFNNRESKESDRKPFYYLNRPRLIIIGVIIMIIYYIKYKLGM